MTRERLTDIGVATGFVVMAGVLSFGFWKVGQTTGETLIADLAVIALWTATFLLVKFVSANFWAPVLIPIKTEVKDPPIKQASPPVGRIVNRTKEIKRNCNCPPNDPPAGC